MIYGSKITFNTGQVDIRNCRVRRIGAYMEVCMVKPETPCIYADDCPPVRLCVHPSRDQILNEDGSLPAQRK